MFLWFICPNVSIFFNIKLNFNDWVLSLVHIPNHYFIIMNRFLSFLAFFVASLSLASCASSQLPAKLSWSDMVAQSPVFAQNHTGFMVYDIEKQTTVADYQAERYFAPASNTKLYTLYAGLCMLGDSIPALRYTTQGDSLIFFGTGDPTFLHPDFPQNNTLNFLKNWSGRLFWWPNVYTGKRFGAGWSWADFGDYYQAELSGFPIYGNIVRFTNKTVSPKMFRDSLRTAGWNENFNLSRDEFSNTFYSTGWPNKPFEQDVPFHISTALTAQLLIDTLKKTFKILPKITSNNIKILHGLPVDTVYRKMLQQSDNMLAEQVLLLCAAAADSTHTTGFDSKKGIDYIKKKYMSDLPDNAVWVDGSGLSRYNLCTPRTTVKLLQKIYAKVPQQRLFSLLAIGGRAGTIRGQYKSEKPFVFAKSGTIANNYSLSGYLVTKSNKVLIFSLMNSNYTRSSAEIRREVERILTDIRDNY
jgi:serine-type D-Ala-D-Ala carboxypeptidase/endopeptidase (penicillin-binding protein 4)